MGNLATVGADEGDGVNLLGGTVGFSVEPTGWADGLAVGERFSRIIGANRGFLLDELVFSRPFNFLLDVLIRFDLDSFVPFLLFEALLPLVALPLGEVSQPSPTSSLSS